MEKSSIKGMDMSLNLTNTKLLSYGLMICLLVSCYHPPYNNFKPDNRAARRMGVDAGVGVVTTAVVTGTTTGILLGGVVGGGIGLVASLQRDSKAHIVKELKKQDIEYVQYGDTNLLIIPTDKYFMFLSPRINELCYPGLNNVIRLLNFSPYSTIYVAGFTDNVGSKKHKNKMSQAQAETMLTYLWSNGIDESRLKAEGYGDKNPVSDNSIIHGSAQNRRIEIEWFNNPHPKQPELAYVK